MLRFFSVFNQSIQMFRGISYIKKAGISGENYTFKCDYILPFTGKWTVINGGNDKDLSHSWDIPQQRYAYDFIVMDDDGNFFKGDLRVPGNFFCYGMDVLAAADGTVVEIKDKYRDSTIDGKHAYCDAADSRGNFVIIKHADGEYSTTSHLMPKSVTVKVGDRVKQGQAIAKCGNSGNSTQPHINFQLQAGKDFFRSVGLPVAFRGISAQVKKGYDSMDERTIQDEIKTIGDKTYIGRGLEVENHEGVTHL